MADDLFQALNMFNQGATQLATGRAIRNASEQAQQINLMEQDEFKKRQAFTQLGQGLAAQLSSYGASPSQVQQMSSNFMPQQMNSPQDFFAASQMATTPEAQQQYAQAGQGMQKQIAEAPLTTAQNEQFKIEKMRLLNERLGAITAGGKIKDEDILSLSDRKMIETLASKQGGKLSITNNLQSLIEAWPTLGPSERLQQGREIMKTLNSAEGADAVGAEEVKRLGSRLEFALGNFTNSNETQFGRDLDGFYRDLRNSTKRLQTSVERNDLAISKIYKKYGKEVPVQKQVVDDIPSQDTGMLNGLQSKIKSLTPEQQERLIQLSNAIKQKQGN